MAANWMKARQTKYWGYAGTYIVVILAVLFAVNFLANRYDKSWDSTANKQFSLSDQTIKLVKGLKQDVKATYFGPTDRFAGPGGAKDLLERYSALSPKFHPVYVDPERKPAIAKASGYRADATVLIDSGSRKEAAKDLTEEELTGAIIRSLKSGERNVCVLQAANEHSIDDESKAEGYGFFKKVLERDNYKVRNVDLKPAAPDTSKPLAVGQPAAQAAVEVPKDCTVLVIAGPQLDYPQPTVDAIKKFEEDGGRELIMLDSVVPLGRSTPPSENAGLTQMLAGWGVTVNKDLVLDLSGVGRLFGLEPDIPLLLSYESHPITQPLTRVPTAYPIVRSLDTKNGDKTSVSKLLGTGEDSAAVTSIGPGGAVDIKKAKKGPFTLAAAGIYNGSTPGRFIVVGTSLWAENDMVGSRSLGNRDLLGNMINWLMSDEDLISIRPKVPEDRPLNLTNEKLTSLRWLSLLIFPLAVVAIGMATWWKRR
jgi:ABC-type uncharacterized transport system involved in gliding motility auxiliary subunit